MGTKRYVFLKDWGIRLEPCPDGDWIGTYSENKREVLENTKAQREQTKGNLRKSEATRIIRKIAELPRVALIERQYHCGNDPDLKRMYLRDHPEYLTVPKSAANLPKRRVFCFPKGRG